MKIFFVDPAIFAPLVTWFAWILLHTIWQGVAIAVLLWLTLRFVKEIRSRLRYGIACTAMLTMATAPLATGLVLWGQSRAMPGSVNVATVAVTVAGPGVTAMHEREFSPPPTMDPSDAPASVARGTVTPSNPLNAVSVIRFVHDTVNRFAGLLVASWLFGVALSATRLWSSFRVVRRLRKSATPVLDVAVSKIFSGLIQRLKLDSGIRLMQSAAIQVPMVIGCLRPLVLLPITCMSGLSIDQIEALLAHELGHLKRHDYLINLMQKFVETVLFYHPAVWWISDEIQNEREHCCDAIALRLVTSRELYANSLVQLATLSTAPTHLALSASGGSLKGRIQRILNVPASESRTSGPAIALTLVFLLTLLFVGTHLLRAAADDAKIEAPTRSKAPDVKNESKPAVPDANAVKPAVHTPAEKLSESDTTKRRNPHGDGFGGGEIFSELGLEAVHKELGLSEDAVAKIKAIGMLYSQEIQLTSTTNAYRIRNLYRDGGGRVNAQEATPEGMPLFKAAVAKFRLQLKEVLTADQYTRLLQITWQDMGTAAFSDDELIAALKITKDQQDKISTINEEYAVKRRELTAQSSRANALNGARELIPMQRELETKIEESLSQELRERYASLKGKAFDVSQVRGPGRFTMGVYGGGRKAVLLSLAENDAVQRDLEFTADETDKIKKLTEEFRAAVVALGEQRVRTRLLSEEDRKLREEKRKQVAEANQATADEAFSKLNEALTEKQFTRLKQIHWQQIGVDALTDPEMIEALPVSKEQQDKIKVIRDEFEARQKIVFSNAGEFGLKMTELDKAQDREIDQTLTKAQLDQFADLIGKEFDLRAAFFERARNAQDQGRGRGPFSRIREPASGEGNTPRMMMVLQRRQLFSFVENNKLQKELGLNVGDVERIRSLGDEVRAAVRESLGEPPDLEQMTAEERNKAIDAIEKVDRSVTDKFLPKLKEILTPAQWTRLKQINWQQAFIFQDAEVIETLAITKDQQEKLQAISAEHQARLDKRFDSVNINTIYASIVPVGKTMQEREQLFEQFKAKINDVLSKDQQEKLTALKGKEFDFSLLYE